MKDQQTTRFTVFACLVCCLFMSGCGEKKPTVKDAEKSARERIAKESEGRIALVGFQPLGENPVASMGSSFRCAFNGDLEFTEDCIWLFDSGTETTHVNFKTVSAQTPPAERPAGELMRKGQHWRIQGGAWIDVENGAWVPSSVNITHNRRVD